MTESRWRAPPGVCMLAAGPLTSPVEPGLWQDSLSGTWRTAGRSLPGRWTSPTPWRGPEATQHKEHQTSFRASTEGTQSHPQLWFTWWDTSYMTVIFTVIDKNYMSNNLSLRYQICSGTWQMMHLYKAPFFLYGHQFTQCGCSVIHWWHDDGIRSTQGFRVLLKDTMTLCVSFCCPPEPGGDNLQGMSSGCWGVRGHDFTRVIHL